MNWKLNTQASWVKSYHIIGEDSPESGTPPDPGSGGKTVIVTIEQDPRTKKPMYKGPDGKPLFTQDHLNFEIGEARKKANEKNTEMVKQLEEMRDRSTTSETMRDELQREIDDLKKVTLTAQQQAELEIKKAHSELEKVQKTLSTDRDFWKERYSSQFVTTEIHAAVAQHKGLENAYEQFEAILGSKARIVPVKDEAGKEIPNQFQAVVDFRDEDADGKPIMTVVPIAKAVERMRALPKRFGNLFLAENQDGVGGTTMLGQKPLTGTTPDFTKMSVAEYAKWREANKDKFTQ